MNVQPRIVFETKTASTGHKAAEQYAAAEFWGGKPREVEWLDRYQFQLRDGVKTYAVEMLKDGFRIIVVSEG